jgi:membrane protease YdiL (CAAX protease family)
MGAMAGPALAAIIMWRYYHHNPVPEWKWSHPKYYLLSVLGMLILWTLPALNGLAFGNLFRLHRPIEAYVWVVIVASFTVGWLAGLGEEIGWTAYLLPHLAPHIGRSLALLVAGAIRGFWHLPVLIGSQIAPVISEPENLRKFIVVLMFVTLQLLLSNALFGTLLGCVWYKTESLPLIGWLHQWFDATRDITILLVIGYTKTLWVRGLWQIPFYLVAVILLLQIWREDCKVS